MVIFEDQTIKLMGFELITPETKFELTVNSVFVYEIQGLSLNKIHMEELKALDYYGTEFSLGIGNSVNETALRLFDDIFTSDDEEIWRKEQRTSPPYLLVHFKYNDPIICPTGYWRNVNGNIDTYNCIRTH